MYKNGFKYLTCVLFISLFLLKGLVSILPALNFNELKFSLVEKIPGTEQDNEENKPGNKAEKEINEFYPHYNFADGLAPVNISCAGLRIRAVNLLNKQDVHLSIPTPPPERL